MINLFDQELQRMERDLRDIKTAHRIGAGSTKFFRKSIDVEFPGNYNIKVKIFDGEPTPPAIIFLYSWGQWAVSSVSASNIYQFNIARSDNVTEPVHVISSAQIEWLVAEAA